MKGRTRLPVGVLVVLTVGLPFLVLLMWSVSGAWFHPSPWPSRWSSRAWSYLADTAQAQVLGALAGSFISAAATAVLSVLVGAPAGRALALYDFRGKDLISVVLLLPILVPPLAAAMGLQYWFIRLGLAETYVGVILAHLGFAAPYATFVMWGVFSNYNPDFEDQARSLGASRLRTAFTVTLPLTLPGLTVAALFAFLISWTQYLATLIIGGGKVSTLPIILFSLIESGDRPVAAAVGLVFTAPALVALALGARFAGRRTMVGVW